MTAEGHDRASSSNAAKGRCGAAFSVVARSAIKFSIDDNFATKAWYIRPSSWIASRPAAGRRLCPNHAAERPLQPGGEIRLISAR